MQQEQVRKVLPYRWDWHAHLVWSTMPNIRERKMRKRIYSCQFIGVWLWERRYSFAREK